MNIESIINRVAPFFIIGFTIALSIAVLLFLSSIIFWGLIIGVVLYSAIAIKEKFFPTQNLKSAIKKKHRPRTFDHDSF